MTLASLLSEKQIIPDMVSTDRWQAIEEMVSCLVRTGHLESSSKGEDMACLLYTSDAADE